MTLLIPVFVVWFFLSIGIAGMTLGDYLLYRRCWSEGLVFFVVMMVSMILFAAPIVALIVAFPVAGQ